MSKRVLILTDSPYYPVNGGADRVVYEQAKGLAELKYQVTVICRDKFSKNSREESIEGSTSYFLGTQSSSVLAEIRKSYQLLNVLIKSFKNNKLFDVVIFHQPIMAYLYRKIFNSKDSSFKIYNYHSPLSLEYFIRHPSKKIQYPILKYVLNKIEKKALSQCEQVVFDSKYMEKLASEVHSLEKSPSKVIPLGVNLNQFNLKEKNLKIREKLNLPLDIPIAFTLRNLEPRMGLTHLLKAWSQVVKTTPDAMLIIGGEGSLRNALTGQIKELNIERQVVLKGYIEDEDLPAFYQAADFFILPTLELEGFGLIILESLACGTPVIGTDVGAIPEILSPFSKELIFSSIEPSVMAEKIIAFIKNKKWKSYSPVLCRKYVEEKYSWSRNLEQFNQLILNNR